MISSILKERKKKMCLRMMLCACVFVLLGPPNCVEKENDLNNGIFPCWNDPTTVTLLMCESFS
jgi:hypothetical protein